MYVLILSYHTVCHVVAWRGVAWRGVSCHVMSYIMVMIIIIIIINRNHNHIMLRHHIMRHHATDIEWSDINLKSDHNGWPKSRFSKILTKIEVIEDFYQNRDFSKGLTKIEIFENIDQNQDFPKMLTKIKNFEIFGQNRNLVKLMLSKIEILRKFWRKSKIFKNNWPKGRLFQKFDQKRDFFTTIEISLKILPNRFFC